MEGCKEVSSGAAGAPAGGASLVATCGSSTFFGLWGDSSAMALNAVTDGWNCENEEDFEDRRLNAG